MAIGPKSPNQTVIETFPRSPRHCAVPPSRLANDWFRGNAAIKSYIYVYIRKDMREEYILMLSSVNRLSIVTRHWPRFWPNANKLPNLAPTLARRAHEIGKPLPDPPVTLAVVGQLEPALGPALSEDRLRIHSGISEWCSRLPIWLRRANQEKLFP